MEFPAAFDRVCHHGLLYKLMSICAGAQFMSMVSGFLSDRRQHLCLDGKISESVGVISRCPRIMFLVPLLLMLHTSEYFHTVRNHVVGYADDTMIYAIVPRALSRSQVIEHEIRIWQQSIPSV